LYY
jgi:hypothetical protein